MWVITFNVKVAVRVVQIGAYSSIQPIIVVNSAQPHALKPIVIWSSRRLFCLSSLQIATDFVKSLFSCVFRVTAENRSFLLSFYSIKETIFSQISTEKVLSMFWPLFVRFEDTLGDKGSQY